MIGVKLDNRDTVQAVSKALKILEILSVAEKCGVSEIARIIGCQKTTAFRLLSTLKSEGYIVQDEDSEKYSLTFKLFRIGAETINNLDISKIALPVLTRLSRESSETIHLCAIDNHQIVYLHKIESSHALKVSMISRVGQSTPFHCTGVGKVLLAYQREDQLKQYLHAPLRKYTEHTITDLETLRAELARVRDAGFAYDDEEHELGVQCIAAPIFNRDSEIIAAISISGPTMRLKGDNLETMRNLVCEAAREISGNMGHIEKTSYPDKG